MKVYTRRGDDGTTALYSGERVGKDSSVIELNGTIDEAQAALGLARARCEARRDVDAILITVERDLWIVMAEVAATPGTARHANAGEVSDEMIDSLEGMIDELEACFQPPRQFSVPGETLLSASLDFARTVVRRAERLAVGDGRTGNVVRYLNRLSDLCWVLARYCEDEHLVNDRKTRTPKRRDRRTRSADGAAEGSSAADTSQKGQVSES